MATTRKTRIIKQSFSEFPPEIIKMLCHCGQIFSQSSKLTSHMFQKHIYSPQFQKMKSIKQQQSQMGQVYKSNTINNHQEKQTRDKSSGLLKDISSSLQVPQKNTKNAAKLKYFKQTQHIENSLYQAVGKPSMNQNDLQQLQRQISTQRSFQIHNLSISPNEAQQKYNTVTELQKQPKRQLTRQFYNSRNFMCGQCLTMFVYSAELNVHVSIKHNGQYPDGCIFGLKKNQILNFFKIPTQKPVFIQTPERQRKYKCGCGCLYSASSSLVNHIKLRHNSVVPSGTINLPQTKRVKQLIVDNTDIAIGF